MALMIQGPFWNLANVFSLSRVALLPFAVWALWEKRTLWLAVILFLMVASDFLDGWVARHAVQVSAWGKILDPSADKLCAAVMLTTLVMMGDFPVWALALIVGKDVLIAAGGWWLSQKETVMVVADFWGKSAMVAEVVAFIVCAFPISWVRGDVIVLMTVHILISSVSYGSAFTRIWCGKTTILELSRQFSARGLRQTANGKLTLVSRVGVVGVATEIIYFILRVAHVI